MLRVFIIFSLLFTCALLEAVVEKCLLSICFFQIKQNPWKKLVKVFIVTKVTGCRPLVLLKLTLSQICFKDLCKSYYLVL